MELPLYKINTPLNYNFEDYKYKPDGVSMTIPDMSYSLKELVDKFTLGNLPVDVVRSVMYSDNPDFDDFIAHEYGDFDLTDYAREMNKLRELHSLRMERRKAAEHTHPDDGEATPQKKEAESSN